MWRNRLYYGIKPLVPYAVRVAVRRAFALRKRGRVKDVWPILPGSERPPEGWRGWPEGKRFALVLTHDVEGRAGLEKCLRLVELEARLGFRSCFYFIPEGDYRLSREFREELAGGGFEVRVHDLYHDGKLFLRKRVFDRNAAKINRYLKEWGCAGFRSAFMLRNLEWIHELDVQYDASTFDTDPFEPQPEGQGTAFPFWVGNGRARRAPEGGAVGWLAAAGEGGSTGYVELPYTLPQDSTLFLMLRERDPAIWMQKLDWVAEHGGMALVNVHPDYLRFEGETSSSRTYPVELYARFLEYARERYDRAFWQATPKELARWFRGTMNGGRAKAEQAERRAGEAQVTGRRKRVAMVTYSNYDADNRVMRYAEALAARGDAVEVLAIKNDRAQADANVVGQVAVSRIQCRERKAETSKAEYLWPVLRFLASASARLAWRHLRRPYDLIHVHNVPDFLVYAAWLPKLGGAKVILDIHDMLPEFYGSKFNSSSGGAGTRLLKVAERRSARFAHHVIISNHLWREKYSARTGMEGRCSVFINNVDSSIFRPRPQTRKDGKLLVLFPGGLQWHQGLDIGIRAFQRVAAELSQAELHIYGDGSVKGQLQALTRELGLEGKVRFFRPRPLREIAGVMAEADLGIVPKRADSFGNEAYSTKIMEFMSVGVPVVVSETKIDRFYFDDTVVRFFESGNAEALAAGMLEVLRDPALRQRLAANGLAYAARNSWDSRRAEYFRLVDALVSERAVGEAGGGRGPGAS